MLPNVGQHAQIEFEVQGIIIEGMVEEVVASYVREKNLSLIGSLPQVVMPSLEEHLPNLHLDFIEFDFESAGVRANPAWVFEGKYPARARKS